LGDALKALAKSHDTIDFAPFELGKPAAQGDAERLQTQLAAEAKKARAVADDARTVEAQAKKLEAELKKDKQPTEAALAVAKAAATSAGELHKLEQAAQSVQAALKERVAALKAAS